MAIIGIVVNEKGPLAVAYERRERRGGWVEIVSLSGERPLLFLNTVVLVPSLNSNNTA